MTIRLAPQALILFLVFATTVQAQLGTSSQDGVWSEVTVSSYQAKGAEPWIQPKNARLFSLNANLLKQKLTATPMEFTARAQSAPQEISIPMPDGSYQRFAIVNSPVMHPALAARYPEIQTFAGQGIDDPSATARVDWTPKGFHAQILRPAGTIYVDPYYNNNPGLYSSYTARDYANPAKKPHHCLVEGNNTKDPRVVSSSIQNSELTSGSTLHTYRLAIACTGEYAAFHGGTKPLVLAAMMTTVNRVIGIYESEVAVRFQLIANNDELIFLNASSDPFTDNDANQMINVISSTINGKIGSSNYDIGHVFSTGGGGLAGLGVVCSASKAEGVTGQNQPVGDPFDVDFVAHEIGHQFNGDHSFNGDSGSCSGGNRNGSTAYEPGSGTTIMAYAGICGNDNLQPNSDSYFHSVSHQQIYGFVSATPCDVETPTGNTPPTIDAGSDFTIPQSTPFELTPASSTDVDGDTLTYTWEERDLGPQQDINAGDNGSSPLFRFWPPTTNPTRVFPRITDLVNNTTVIGETLPTTTRTMTFRCTVRDNRAGGGGVSSDDMTVSVIASSGPFAVTFPNNALTLSGNQTVTWNVAGTAGGAVNTPNVDILLSTDGGMTYPTTLVSSVPNNGSAMVTFPNINTSTARIKVKGSENIFFDISNVNFTIEPASGLTVTPIDNLVSSGLEGVGPYTPTCQTYTLENDTPAPLNWEAETSTGWSSVTPSNGTLATGTSVMVEVCIEAAATGLAPGFHQANVVFSNATATSAQQRQVELTVLPAGGDLQFVDGMVDVDEDVGTVTVGVERGGDTTGNVGVSYLTTSGSASAGTDYLASAGTLAWADGEGGVKTFTIDVLEDDFLEPDEDLTLTLSNPTGGAEIGINSSIPMVIHDNDSNDQCGSALLIAATPFDNSQDTSSATSTGDPTTSCVNNFGNGVWYRYTASTNGTLTIDTINSDYDTVLAIFTSGCGSFVEVACNDDGGGDLTSLIALSVTEGVTYHILAGGFNSAVGTLQVNAGFVPGTVGAGNNDLCSDAIHVTTTPFLDSRSTATATSTADPIPTCGDNGGNGVWYRFVPTSDGDLSVSLRGSSHDTVLAIYTGTCGALTELDCNDDTAATELTSSVTLPVTASNTYFILAAGYEGETGNLLIEIEFGVCSEGIADGTFEAGGPWSEWTIQTSTQFGTPLCDTSVCPSGPGFGPRSGANWAFFGTPGGAVAETATVGQAVTLPVGSTVTLSYELWIGTVTAPFTDTLEVRVDDTPLTTITEPSEDEPGYIPEMVDLSAFADGSAHTIELRYVSPLNGGVADWNVDDISIMICEPDFDEDGIPDSTDPDDDNDEIPDQWELDNGLDPMDPSDAVLDVDGDGVNGFNEYIADTSPTNNLSVLTLKLEDGTTMLNEQQLSFDSSTSRTYFIQFNLNLVTGLWMNAGTNIPGDSGSTMVTVTNSAPTVIYRLGVEAP